MASAARRGRRPPWVSTALACVFAASVANAMQARPWTAMPPHERPSPGKVDPARAAPSTTGAMPHVPFTTPPTPAVVSMVMGAHDSLVHVVSTGLFRFSLALGALAVFALANWMLARRRLLVAIGAPLATALMAAGGPGAFNLVPAETPCAGYSRHGD